jgi:predicted transcriptional regulator
MTEQNNTMIPTILSHLGNLSSQVLTELLRRHRRYLTDMTRQLSVSWNDASIIHIKTVGTYLPFRLIEPSFLWL